MKRKLSIILLFIILISRPANADILGLVDSAIGFFSSTKDKIKDAVNLTSILGDLKLINKETRDKISDLYDKVEEANKGENLIEVSETLIDESISDDAYKLDADLEAIDYVISKHTGKNIYKDIKRLPIELFQSKKEAPVLSKTTVENIGKVNEDQQKIKDMLPRSREELNLKNQSSQLKTTLKIEDHARRQAIDTKTLADKARREDAEQQYFDDLCNVYDEKVINIDYNEYRWYLR